MRMHLIPLVLAGLACLPCVAEARQPNIVFILADDVGHEVLGCYGGESYPTPHLDELASRGVQGASIPVLPGISPGSGPGHPPVQPDREIPSIAPAESCRPS